MRAMEYTPAPPPPEPIHPGRYAEGWEWDKFEDDLERQCVEEKTVYYKHLTDAECAAEYWRAMYDVMAMIAQDLGFQATPRPLTMRDVIRWGEVAGRFASHPHASEVEA